MHGRHSTGNVKRIEMTLTATRETAARPAAAETVKLTRGNSKTRFFCLAGSGGRTVGGVKATASADRVLVLDGCPVGYGKKAADAAGMTGYTYLALRALGIDRKDVLAWQPGDMDNAIDVYMKLAEMQREAEN